MLAAAFRKLRIRLRRNVKSLPGSPDFVFSHARVAVFCDGDFWHGKSWAARREKLERGHNGEYWVAKIESNRKRDRQVRKHLSRLGYRVVRVWESEVRRDPAAAAARVCGALTAKPERRKNGVMAPGTEKKFAERTAISLYTGAGGLDLGFEAAGFATRVGVEMDTEAVATLRANRDWPILDRDIHEASSRSLLRSARLRVGEADVLIGGPPCQPFSKAGYWASGDTLRLDDERAGTLAAYLRVLRDTLPKAFLLENVPGLAYRGKSEGLELIQRTIDRINRERRVSYSVSVAQLNAADFGVPQTRERVFVIGFRDGHSFRFPTPTHYDPERGMSLLAAHPYLTAWDAIGDLEDEADSALRVRGKWADLLPSIPEGWNYLWHTDRGGGLELFGWRRRFWTFLLKLSKERPSWTVQAQPGPAVGPFHWKSRRLSARELCRIQTIPDNYNILGPISSVQKQIGNAVPSALAELLARAIRVQGFGEDIPEVPTLLPGRRQPVPPAEPTAAVPQKFVHLEGDHEPHPGTGLGHAAVRRRENHPDPAATQAQVAQPL